MSKQQMIEAICQRNPSANQQFLDRFDEKMLDSYLRRLSTISGCRGRESRWIREGDTPAIVAHRHA